MPSSTSGAVRSLDFRHCGIGRWAARSGDSSGRYEGADVGGEVSGFVVDATPGEGPGLHRHPYGESFLVLGGRGRFTVGESQIDAVPGDLVRVAPEVPHCFRSLGPDRLRLVTIHAGPRIEQTNLETS